VCDDFSTNAHIKFYVLLRLLLLVLTMLLDGLDEEFYCLLLMPDALSKQFRLSTNTIHLKVANKEIKLKCVCF
jgi:hypothetical protein